MALLKARHAGLIARSQREAGASSPAADDFIMTRDFKDDFQDGEAVVSA